MQRPLHKLKELGAYLDRREHQIAMSEGWPQTLWRRWYSVKNPTIHVDHYPWGLIVASYLSGYVFLLFKTRDSWLRVFGALPLPYVVYVHLRVSKDLRDEEWSQRRDIILSKRKSAALAKLRFRLIELGEDPADSNPYFGHFDADLLKDYEDHWSEQGAREYWGQEDAERSLEEKPL